MREKGLEHANKLRTNIFKSREATHGGKARGIRYFCEPGRMATNLPLALFWQSLQMISI
jgi:hypothetical protein